MHILTTHVVKILVTASAMQCSKFEKEFCSELHEHLIRDIWKIMRVYRLVLFTEIKFCL